MEKLDNLNLKLGNTYKFKIKKSGVSEYHPKVYEAELTAIVKAGTLPKVSDIEKLLLGSRGDLYEWFQNYLIKNKDSRSPKNFESFIRSSFLLPYNSMIKPKELNRYIFDDKVLLYGTNEIMIVS